MVPERCARLISLLILGVLAACNDRPPPPPPDVSCEPFMRIDTLPIRAGEFGVPQLSLANACGPGWLESVSWNVTLNDESVNAAIEEAVAAGQQSIDGDRLELTLNSLELEPGRAYRMVAEAVGSDGRHAAADAELGIDWGESPIFLGELFAEVVDGRMFPPSVLPPGGMLNVLVGGSLPDEQLDVRLTPVGPGIPAERFQSIPAVWTAFDASLETDLRAIVITLPKVDPGYYWLSVRIGTQSFPWRQVELAQDGEMLADRAKRFAAFDELLAGKDEAPEDFILRAPFGVTDASSVAYRFPDAARVAIPAGSRVQFALRASEAAEASLRPPMYLYLETPTEDAPPVEAPAVTPVFAMADQFLQYAPGQTPGFERGWLWDRRVGGGTCGTAQCRFGYPFPGNTGTFIGDPSTLAVVTPPRPDPFDWWRNRPTAGGICGTGYCNPPFPLGDWPNRPPPIDTGPLAAGVADDDSDSEGTDDDEGTTERPPLTSVPRPTPVTSPPRTCTAEFVEEVAGFNYDRRRRGKGTRVRPYNPITQEPAIYTNLPERRATLWYSVMPKDWDSTSGSTPAWPDDRVRFETEAARAWYDQYCIRLTFRRVTLRREDESRLGQANEQLAARLPANLRASIVGQNLADSRALLSASVYAHHFASRGRDARDVSILFMDRAVGDVGKRGATARPSQGSFNILYFNGVALHSKDADADRQYILTHELTHAYGRVHNGKRWSRRRPVSYRDIMSIGAHSWYHDSAAEKAMSRVTREHVADPLGLDDGKLYDYAEYVDALESNLLRR